MNFATPKPTTKTRGRPVSMRVLTDTPDREENFSAWLLNQATELRTRKPAGIDWQHVAEELEEVAARIRLALLSDLEIVIIHLLKLQFETSANEWRGGSRNWKLHAAEHRDRVTDILENEHTLRNKFDEFVDKAYPRARRRAALETGRSKSHDTDECPWSVAQILDNEFFPEPFK
jgi:Domain of unknown function DUF29